MPLLFHYMSFALPLQTLRETATLLAFAHPAPAYRVHILIVPRRAPASLAALDGRDQAFLADLVQVVQSLVAELDLAPQGYRLIANGGAFQDFPVLHFHLVSGAPLDGPGGVNR